MPSSSKALFVGRDTFLQDMHAILRRERRLVITGAGGVGKTETAREYIRRFSHHYQSVFWLNASTEETFLADLFATMQSLSLPFNMDQGVSRLLQTLRDYLASQQDVLFVLDDFSRRFMVQDVPGQQQSHFLLITRFPTIPSEIPQMELTRLDEHEGALLVLRRAKLLTMHATLDQISEEQRMAALELTRELRGLPLSLNLAGGYLCEKRYSIQDYLFTFRDHPVRSHQLNNLGGRDREEIAVACELSLLHLEQTQATVLELLQICALLVPEAIPLALFQQENKAMGGEQTWSKESVQSLLDYGLLVAGSADSLLNIHPLVQEIVHHLSLGDEQQRIKQALQLFHRLLPSLETQSLSTRLRVAEHIQRLVKPGEEWRNNFNEAAEVCNWAASLFRELKMLSTAEALSRRALSIWQSTLGNFHPTVAVVLGNLAELNGLLKNYAEAEALFQRAITCKAMALGAGHPDVLLFLDHLGRLYAEQGKQEEARSCYEKAISIGDQVTLRLHPVYRTCLYDLALLFIEQEQFEKAESLILRVCAAWKRSPDSQDLSTMTAWVKLAEVATRLQHWRQAEIGYQHALPVCEQLLGEEHPITLGHLERAATVLLRRGKLSEAKRNFLRVIEVSERSSDIGQIDIVACLSGLAQIALADEQLPEACALLERAQTIYASQPAPENLARAALLDTLASVEIAQQHYERAVAAYKQALELRTQMLGDEHLELIENLSGLATLYLKLGQTRQAEPLLLRVLYIHQRMQKPEDFVLDPVLNGLADIEIEREHFDMARMYLERSRAIRELALGQDDPRTREVWQKLAEVPGA